MKKITDIYEDRLLTREDRDTNGKIMLSKKPMRYKRDVRLPKPGKRLIGFVVDMLLIHLVYFIAVKYLFEINYVLFTSLVAFSYYVALETFLQQTMGKLITSTRVVNDNGNIPTFSQVLIWTLIRFIPWDPFTLFTATVDGTTNGQRHGY